MDMKRTVERLPGQCFTTPARLLRAASVLAALLITAFPCVARADKKPSGPDFSRGALYGTVLDSLTGKPLPDATVAVVTPNGKVLAWTRTNAEGKYAIAADTYAVLHLRPSHRRGLLEEICRSVGNIVMAPVRVAVDAVSRPGDTVKSAVEATIMGNPAPLTAQVAGSLSGRVKATPADAELSARHAACKEVFCERQAPKKDSKPGLLPGELSLAVSAAGYRALKSAAGAYWLEPPIEEKQKRRVGVQAWMETVRLAPAAAPADKKSDVAREALLLTDAQAEPALVPAGAKVHLSVRLNNPVGFGPKVRIFAREKQKDTVTELTAADPKAPDLFTGDLALDKNLPGGDTQIAIGVLRTEPLEVKIPKAKTDPLLKFAGRIDELEAGKPFDYDPRIFACENRMDLTITVLDPKQVTPTASSGPVHASPGAPGLTATPGGAVPPPPGKPASPASAPSPTTPPSAPAGPPAGKGAPTGGPASPIPPPAAPAGKGSAPR
jgi:hypothetical protein